MTIRIKSEEILLDIRKRFKENPKRIFEVICNGDFSQSKLLINELEKIGARYILSDQPVYESLRSFNVPYSFIKENYLSENYYNLDLRKMKII